jgi:hypothetical protein
MAHNLWQKGGDGLAGTQYPFWVRVILLQNLNLSRSLSCR